MVLFTGKTVEDAIQNGLTALNLTRSQASITVLAKEKKGFLGLFGNKPAQVDVTAQEATPTPAVDLPEVKAEPKNEPAPTPQVPEVDDQPQQALASADDFEAFVAKEFVADRPAEEASADLDQARQDVLTYVEKVIYEMDLEASISVRGNRRQIILQIETPEPGRIIGYHGKVLKSLQLLAQNYLHDRYGRQFKVALNVHDYLEHRMETLVDMAHKAADKVRATGRPYQMNPMTNTERKVIHKTIARISGVESYSEGDDPDRYVVVVSRD